MKEKENREGKEGKYSKKEKVMTDKQTEFPLVDFCGRGRVKIISGGCVKIITTLHRGGIA